MYASAVKYSPGFIKQRFDGWRRPVLQGKYREPPNVQIALGTSPEEDGDVSRRNASQILEPITHM